MRSIELLYIDLLTSILSDATLRLVLVQGLALWSAKWPSALFALDVILRLNAVETAKAHGG